MKLRLLALLVIASFSINVMAEEGQGYVILATRITSSPNFKGEIIHLPISSKKNFISNSITLVDDVHGSIYENIKVVSHHKITIANTTDKDQRYTYIFHINCGEMQQHFERDIILHAEGWFEDTAVNFGAVQPYKIGIYPINAYTKVEGDGYSYSEAHGKLTVTARH